MPAIKKVVVLTYKITIVSFREFPKAVPSAEVEYGIVKLQIIISGTIFCI